ncbi:MAG: dTDP-4-dehydrorhamnose 3,5-epimerase [Candidatus Moraniibacteriota bacterium]|nr:MAG: dTDP-4-dehydrorhamnose 3,5-epimerase [Candidatus Moranbacteria bacterium]
MGKKEIFIKGLLVFTPDIYKDERGFFFESFNSYRYQEEIGIHFSFVQDNVSQSNRGVIRGLHFQKKPHEQGKLVSVLFGRVWDVAVDIRPKSETFGKWFGLELSGENHKQFWIPPGFAHGFIALEDNTIFSYKCTDVYSPECEGSLLWNDPTIAISWPMEKNAVIISKKDAVSMTFKEFQRKIL